MVTYPTSDAFRRKLLSFSELRLAPLFNAADLKQLTGYMQALVERGQFPPMRGTLVDWSEITIACNFSASLTGKQKRVGQFGFDAIIRWINDGGRSPQSIDARSDIRSTRKPNSPRSAAQRKSIDEHERAKPGPKPAPIEDIPKPLFAITDDPISFQAAFALQLKRFGETYYHLHRAVVRPGDDFDNKTMLSWVKGTKVPRSLHSFEILGRIEQRYSLPTGYFKKKLPHQSRSASGHDVGENISPAERRRLAWHLPDNFNKLPHEKREEILEWIRRVVISGATDYRRFQAAASKQRYAIRFPAMAYGGRASTRPCVSHSNLFTDHGDIDDPDLLSGVIDAPPQLTLEMASLITFKTATLTEIGFQRNGVWGEETASQKLEHLGLMFGALAASPKGEVAGRGLALGHLTFGLLVFPSVWDWYLQWRERRRGFFTAWEVDMLSISLALTREETGWLRQHPELADRLVPIDGLITAEDVALAKRDWHACCEAFHAHARTRIKEIQMQIPRHVAP
jgi:hypothetical protein